MQSLNLVSESNTSEETVAKNGFWRRQFQTEPTKSQKIFDWIFGIGLPLVCVVADPIVFKGNMGPPLLGFAKPFAYLFSFISILAMLGWLIVGKRLRWFGAPVGGLMITGAAIAAGIGTIILPFSVMGIAFGIGLLGFTPFFSSVVYLRSGIRAIRNARNYSDKRLVTYAAILAGLFGVVIPYVVNVAINN